MRVVNIQQECIFQHDANPFSIDAGYAVPPRFLAMSFVFAYIRPKLKREGSPIQGPPCSCLFMLGFSPSTVNFGGFPDTAIFMERSPLYISPRIQALR